MKKFLAKNLPKTNWGKKYFGSGYIFGLNIFWVLNILIQKLLLSKSKFRWPGRMPPEQILGERLSITSANFGPPPSLCQQDQHRSLPQLPTHSNLLNTWTEGELLDDLYKTFQIIKIYFSITIRNLFWGVGAVFKDIKPLFMKKFISLLIILQQYLLNVSTLPSLTCKVPAHHHFG